MDTHKNDTHKNNKETSKVSTDLNNWLSNLTVTKKALSMPTLHCTRCRIPPRPT